MNSQGTLTEFFIHDHRACDEHWSAVEDAVERQDLSTVCTAWDAFQQRQRHHLAMEEEVLFPAIEAASGMSGGPTDVMRMEHAQMLAVLDQMAAAVEERDFQELIDLGDTLLILTQQHNEKEEGMLYPMAEETIGADWVELKQRLDLV